jgi:hypothetical protein
MLLLLVLLLQMLTSYNSRTETTCVLQEKAAAHCATLQPTRPTTEQQVVLPCHRNVLHMLTQLQQSAQWL